MTKLEEVILTVDEFESIRLKDVEGHEQEDCAAQMNISQPTFHRIYLEARKKIADSLVHGKSLKIQGGTYQLHPEQRQIQKRRCYRRGR